MKHVSNGCLSDPPGISMHHKNPTTGKCYCQRGTSTIEADHKGLDDLIGNHVGIGLCDRKASTYFELLNEKKRINRLGGDNYGTHRTETLALLNSLAVSCGHGDTNLPFPNLSVPTLPPLNEREYFGFTSASLTQDEFLRRYEALQPGIETEGETANDFGKDLDPEEAPTDKVLQDLAEEEAEEREEQEADITKTVSDDDPAIQAEVDRITPLIRPNETTAQAFARLTNHQPWYPFHTGSTPPSDIHKEEFTLFDSMESRFKRGVRPRGKNGYHYFANEWNVEVANRYSCHIDGEEVVLIRRKSAVQFQEHYDNLQQKKRMAAVADSEDDRTNRLELLEVMRSTRNEATMPAIPTAPTLKYPSDGVVPFGMPAAMHPSVLQGAVIPQNNATIMANMTDVGCPWGICQFATTRNPLVEFKKNTWCVTCGHRKAAHVQEESFGYKCRRDCCAKCGWRQEHHQFSSGRMGPHCNNHSKYDSPHSQWYEDSEQRRVGVI